MVDESAMDYKVIRLSQSLKLKALGNYTIIKHFSTFFPSLFILSSAMEINVLSVLINIFEIILA